jgi:hypothetical protein
MARQSHGITSIQHDPDCALRAPVEGINRATAKFDQARTRAAELREAGKLGEASIALLDMLDASQEANEHRRAVSRVALSACRCKPPRNK